MAFNADFYVVRDRVRNWGRWGDDDQIGTLNLITNDAVAAAGALIQSGHRVSCAMPLHANGVQIGQVPGRVNPLHTMIAIDHSNLGGGDESFHSSDDVVTMGLQAATHWDGLAHVSYGGRLYNNFPASSITAHSGATKLGIENVKLLCGRGVLLDVAAAKGLDLLPGGYDITSEDLDEAAEFGKVEVRPGDIIVLRTGRTRLIVTGGPTAYMMGAEQDASSPGPGLSAVEWFHRNDVAAVANDTFIFEVFPGPVPDNMLAVHCLDIVDMGMTQGQNWDLQALSDTCSELSRYEFFLSANPEPFVGGCGSPVHPLAVF